MPVVLAADIGGLLAIGFLLISFVGWIVNLINAQNPPPAPNRGPQGGPRPRDRKVQNEIEQFLQEAMGQKKKGGRREEIAADEIEILEPAPQRRPPTGRRQPTPQTPPPQRPPTPKRSNDDGQAAASVRDTVISSADLGQGLASHVQEQMREHVSQDASRYLGDKVDQEVTLHLGQFTADDRDPRASVKPQYRSIGQHRRRGRLHRRTAATGRDAQGDTASGDPRQAAGTAEVTTADGGKAFEVDKPLKVLLLAGRFEVRGSSARTLHLAEHLPSRGIEPRLVCIDACRVDPDRLANYSVLAQPMLDMPIFDRFYRQFLYRDHADDPPDLIHIQWRGMLPLGRWLANKFQRPYILTVHDYLGPKEVFRFDQKWGRSIVAVSESVRDELLSRTKLSRDLVTVIHSGVPVDDIDCGLPVLDAGHTPVVGTAGPLEAAKGLDYFLLAAQIVSASQPDVQFVISGAGPEEKQLRRLVSEFKLTGQVTFVPNVFDFAESLAAMDIFCLPALKQGLGTIMLEAMARGKPVIATQAGGVDSVVSEGQTGLLVPPSDAEHLAARMLELLDDPMRARSIGQSAQELVRREFPRRHDGRSHDATVPQRRREVVDFSDGQEGERQADSRGVCMKAEIVAIGSELTSGAKLDTNSQWLSQHLTDLGIVVHFHSTVADDLQENVDVLRTAAERADLVLVTGGLGPTLDDLTRQALAQLARVELVLDESSLLAIRAMFLGRGRTMPERNEIQAMFPAGSVPLANPIGTAPGIWFEYRATSDHCCRFAAMPGVPSEMFRMFDEQVRPRLPVSGSVIRRARINCFGIGESHTEQLLGDLTARGRDPEVGITAHEATITLRISAHGRSVVECDAKISAAAVEARRVLGHYVYGIEDEELEDVVVRELLARGLTVATVESGTGGLMSHRLMSVAGAESCLAGGLILPTVAVQQREFDLPAEVFGEQGGISETASGELARRCREHFASDFALSITTDRGEQRETDDPSRPAAWVALASSEGIHAQAVYRLANPHIHRSRTVKAALNLLRLHLNDPALLKSVRR